MVSEVVIDFYALNFATQFHAALHAFVCLQALYSCSNIDPYMMSRCDGSDAILHVMHTGNIPFYERTAYHFPSRTVTKFC